MDVLVLKHDLCHGNTTVMDHQVRVGVELTNGA